MRGKLAACFKDMEFALELIRERPGSRECEGGGKQGSKHFLRVPNIKHCS